MSFVFGISIIISSFWLYVCIFCMYWYYGYRAVIADLEENKVSLVFFVCIIYSGDEETDSQLSPSPASENTGRFKSNPETNVIKVFLVVFLPLLKTHLPTPRV